MKKTITYLERPFFIFNNHIMNAIPDKININASGKVIYTFNIEKYCLVLSESEVYETEKEAKRYFIN